MRWQMGRRSSNVEDLRGSRFGGRMPGGMKMGCGTIVLILIVSFLFGQNPLQLLTLLTGGGSGMQMQVPENYQPSAEENQAADFVSVMLADMEDTWPALLQPMGAYYEQPKLVLFSDMVQSACGFNEAASGPFYCPLDQKVYIDLSFFNELNRLGAPGDFAQAYVIAHEVGHHVQTLLGTSSRVRQMQERAGSEAEANALSVALELQADCYAGVWAYHANQQRQMLEPGDVEEGLQAAASIGDDRLMRMSGRAVQPESFTHGTSEQRAQWLRTGLSTGDCEACDTFSALR